jgi:hypothetical protein
MAFLPLAARGRTRHAEYMDAYTCSASGQRASWTVRFARRVGRALSEINEANKRASTLLLSYGLAESDRAPDTYSEFLLRSRATVLREPAASRRSAGRQVG